jgi:hypothetical protein
MTIPQISRWPHSEHGRLTKVKDHRGWAWFDSDGAMVNHSDGLPANVIAEVTALISEKSAAQPEGQTARSL